MSVFVEFQWASRCYLAKGFRKLMRVVMYSKIIIGLGGDEVCKLVREYNY